MRQLQRAYDLKYLISCLMKMIFFIGMMYCTQGVGILVTVPFFLTALGSRKQEDVLFYLVFIGTVVVGNSVIIPKNAWFFLAQRCIMLIFAGMAMLQVFGQRHSSLLSPLLGIVVYVGYMILPSAFGFCALISYLKIALFLIVFFAYYGVVNDYTKTHLSIAKIRSILLSFAILYIGGSVALIPFPNLSQLSGEAYLEALLAGVDVTSLFVGMTNQSQSLGPVVAGLACVLLGDLLFGIKRADKLYIFLLLCCPVLIYKTSSRTAMGTYLVGLMSLLYFFLRSRFIGSRWKSRVFSVAMLLFIFGCIALISLSSLRTSVTRFVLKWSNDASQLNYETIISSRQGLMDRAMDNFKMKPLIGNGFQVSDAMQGFGVHDIRQILSAPIEKGVWITAVLEEGGVIGFVLFSGFLFFAVVLMVKRQAYCGAAFLITFVVSNLGEFTMFSISYTGGFMWAMLFLSVAIDIARLKDVQYQLM